MDVGLETAGSQFGNASTLCNQVGDVCWACCTTAAGPEDMYAFQGSLSALLLEKVVSR
jgi:hypothetical protein